MIGLPTTLKMPRFASAFRVTHRFTRSLGAGDFGDLAEDFFGFDGGAQIGLEYRFGIMSGTQIGIHRTSDRTIQFFAQHHLIGQGTQSRRRRRHRHRGRHQQLPRQLLAGDRRGDVARRSAVTARCMRTRSG